ncbi:hypothetical protein AWV79_23135 [Cupriavidus sp. UYMMa02A]|nr:hypothetical protein AWV79_23135 [Cupriavidus sp. UYMMa02A]
MSRHADTPVQPAQDSGAVRRPLSGLRTLDLATELAAPFNCTRRAGFARVFEAMRGLTTRAATPAGASVQHVGENRTGSCGHVFHDPTRPAMGRVGVRAKNNNFALLSKT